jgi:hypothetical protein
VCSSPVARADSLFPSNFNHDASLFSPAKRIEARSGRGDAARDDHGRVLTSLVFQQCIMTVVVVVAKNRCREGKIFFGCLVATSEPASVLYS